MTTMECDGTFGPGFRQTKCMAGLHQLMRSLDGYAEINWRKH